MYSPWCCHRFASQSDLTTTTAHRVSSVQTCVIATRSGRRFLHQECKWMRSIVTSFARRRRCGIVAIVVRFVVMSSRNYRLVMSIPGAPVSRYFPNKLDALRYSGTRISKYLLFSPIPCSFIRFFNHFVCESSETRQRDVDYFY